ncbi:hypothetical protein ARMGADRAFT_1146487 [Armillaria gallica]|uniref:Uncharacterized protein n=1 Tax=Armillaria gallica TaxID=47427 RepID=A0A2H3CDP8_ARMGA|nr:hypothetical protein ARMGADRAFT_1146487 [Armillaria gallica]
MPSAYSKTLEGVNSQGKYDKELAYHIFGWIAFTRRSLSTLELQHALAVKPDTTALDPENLCSEDLLGSVCGGLVITTRMDDYTTQEYFMSQKDSLFPQLQETIAHTCLTYMLFNDLDIRRKQDINQLVARLVNCTPLPDNHNANYIRLYYSNSTKNMARGTLHAKYPFLRYSLQHWRDHAIKLPVEEIVAFLDSACCEKIVKIFHTGRGVTEVPV